MAVTNCYKVNWHEEIGGRMVGNYQTSWIQAAASDYNSIRTVLVTNQGLTHGGATLVVDNVANVGPVGILQ